MDIPPDGVFRTLDLNQDIGNEMEKALATLENSNPELEGMPKRNIAIDATKGNQSQRTPPLPLRIRTGFNPMGQISNAVLVTRVIPWPPHHYPDSEEKFT
jgi:hypothetical protein